MVTVAMFRRVRLKTNPEKTKSMVYTPGYIWVNLSEEAYTLWAAGEVAALR